MNNNPAAAVGMWREILLRLPAVSLLRLRAVCKGWCSVIDDPRFIKAHDQLSSNRPTFIIRNSTGPPFCPLYHIDLEDLNFTNGLQTIPATPLKLTRHGLSCLKAFPVPACNGLLLIAPVKATEEDVWEIWNPLTEERLMLPQPTNIKYSDLRVVGVGLGYDCAADDYKVVVIGYDKQTHVYSLRSDTWRTTTIGCCPLSEERFCNPNGVFLSGALHWVSESRIVVFDVGTESYRQLALPSSSDGDLPLRRMHLDLEVLSGCLFLSWMNDFWVMNDFGGKQTWTKLFSLYFDVRPVAFSKNKRPRVLLHRKKGEFFWFDVESETSKRIEIHGISSRYCSAQVYVGSLFRLHDSCGCGRRAPPSKTRNLKMAAAHTKLTFCLRDGDDHKYKLHDNCHSTCPNWYHSESRIIKLVCETSTFDPDGNSFTLLPLDIWREIFLRSPAKSVIQLRAVCRDWKAVIDDPCFVKAHTTTNNNNNTVVMIRNKTGPPFHPLYSFDLDQLDFTQALQTITATPREFTGLTTRFPCLPVAGCNGLMVVAAENEKLQLWNPLTNESLELPQVEGFINSNPTGDVAIGLGYEQATDDYKVVVIHVDMYQTHVYSLRSDSWNVILDGDCTLDDDYRYPEGPGVFLCGALHWLSSWESEIKITVLDLVTESYRQIRGPGLGRVGRMLVDGNRCLDVLGGCLVVSDSGASSEAAHYDLWVMKDYGSEDSWFKLITFDKHCDWPEYNKFFGRGEHLRPLTYLNNKTQILMQDDKGFYLHDVESDDSMKNVICIHGLAENLSSQIFSRSIFRLHDNCGVGGKRRMRKRKSKMNSLADTELGFCVRDVHPANYYYAYGSHDGCYTVDSNWYCSSSENED